MTVYKKVPLEASAAAKAAVQLLKGQKVTGINGYCDASKNVCSPKKSGKASASVLLTPITITKANYKILFADKFLKRGEVCVGAYVKFCK
jgi:D-xylose transport system substrate-binding protein